MSLMRKLLDRFAARRAPDFVIGDRYLLRWWILPRNRWFNIYLHNIRKSDDDRALHDHPWLNCSIVLSGSYREIMPTRSARRRAGSVVLRRATALHRLEIDAPPNDCWTLFITGPRIREWGFQCPNGWRPWQEFTSPQDTGQIGRGCE